MAELKIDKWGWISLEGGEFRTKGVKLTCSREGDGKYRLPNGGMKLFLMKAARDRLDEMIRDYDKS